MAKFLLTTNKSYFVGGVLKTFKSGEYETKDKSEIDALKLLKGVTEVKPSTKKVD